MTKMTHRNGIKAGLAVSAALALTLGGLTPAIAADYQLGPDDIASHENPDETSGTYNYDTWHIGSDDNPDALLEWSVEFGECSITTLAHDAASVGRVVQVLKGFPIDGRPTTENTGDTSELEALINSISIDVVQGSVTLQLPFFGYWDGDLEDRNFTTFRNAVGFGPGVHNLGGAEITSTSGLLTVDGTHDSISDLLAQMQDDIDEYGDIFELLGVGFTGSEDAEVASISFGGDTYYFGTGDCLPVIEDEEEEEAPEPTPVPAPTPPSRVDTDA